MSLMNGVFERWCLVKKIEAWRRGYKAKFLALLKSRKCEPSPSFVWSKLALISVSSAYSTKAEPKKAVFLLLSVSAGAGLALAVDLLGVR